MKNIPNLQTSLPPIKVGGNPATYADLLNACLDNNPGGFTTDLMRKRLRVSAALDKVKAGDKFSLEDADFETAKNAVAAMVWSVKSAELIKFAEIFGA